MKVDVYKKYHADIVKVWEMGEKIPEFKNIYNLNAFTQDFLYENTILFLGVGASDGEKELKDGTRRKKTCTIKNSGNCEYHYEREEGRIKYDYYKKMIKLAKITGFENWSNIDITLFRETRQKIIRPFYKNFTKIMQAHFDLAKKMIIYIKPKVIIASNAFVRDVIKGDAYIDTGFILLDDKKTIHKYGTPLINSPDELKNIPIFFTSMLSGAGALDNGSFDRLSWHIKYVLERL